MIGGGLGKIKGGGLGWASQEPRVPALVKVPNLECGTMSWGEG